MENGNGQASVQGFINAPYAFQPYQPQDISVVTTGTAPMIAEGVTAIPSAPSPRKPRWYETEEGRAKRSVAMKAGWAKRRRRLQAQEQAKAAPVNKPSDIDAAIAYHLNAINTLRAAKALLN